MPLPPIRLATERMKGKADPWLFDSPLGFGILAAAAEPTLQRECLNGSGALGSSPLPDDYPAMRVSRRLAAFQESFSYT